MRVNAPMDKSGSVVSNVLHAGAKRELNTFYRTKSSSVGMGLIDDV
jgi:hypothetical protein